MRNNVFPLVLIAIVSVLVACTPVQIDQPDQLIRGYLPSVERACLGAQNAQRLGTQQNNSTEYNCEPAGSGVIAKRDLSGDGTYLTPNNLPFSGEWAFNKEKTDKGKTRAPPKVCLALSGGGVRSASFSLGILKSLSLHDISTEDRKNLGDVDVVSSVSGGGYALAWLIMQYYHHRDDHTFSHKMLFSAAAENGSRNNSTDESQYIRYIAAHSNIITSTEYVSLLGANVVSAPVNFGLNGLFGSHTNTTPARSAYEKSLRKTYARDPSHPLSTVDDVSFNELLRYYDNHREDDAAVRAPFFIINTTAFIEEDIRHYGAALANSIYDFTILQYGSDALGRYVYPNTSLPELNKGAQFFAQDARTSYSGTLRDDHPMSFMRAISVSGAALDGSALVAGYSQRVLFSLLNVDLGFYINNPGLSPRTRQHRRFLPWPLYYFFGNYARDARGTDIYLSDGAHAENLGAFSLVRRLCKEIIVVDAEYDPSYVFEAYSLLKHNLSTQLGVSLRIKEIDDKLQFAEFTKKNECEYLDPQRRTECKTQKNAMTMLLKNEMRICRNGIQRLVVVRAVRDGNILPSIQ